MKRAIGAIAAIALLALAGCEEDPQEIPGLKVVEMRLAPVAPTLEVGDTVRLTARPLNEDGIELGSVLVDWDVTDASVAEVTVKYNTVLVRAKSAGVTRIAASADGKLAEATITVQPQPVASVLIAPHAAELLVGQQLQLTASARAADGNTLNGRAMAWTTSTPGLVQLTQAPGNTGSVLITALAAGTARLTVTCEGVKQDVQVVISSPQQQPVGIVFNPPFRILDIGDTMTVNAELHAADGSVVPGIPVIFSSSNEAILKVLPQLPGTSATVVALAPGVAVLNAMGAGYQALATITVNSPPPPPTPVAFVQVRPREAGMWAGTNRRFTAATLAQNGLPLADRYISWSVQDADFGTVDATGSFFAPNRAGTQKLYATSEGKRGEAVVHVYPITDVMTFQLTFDWFDGEIHLVPSLAHGTFTDSAGVVHQTELYPEAGTFTIDRMAGTYERRIVAAEWVMTSGVVHKRREVMLIDSGNMLYRWNPYVDGASTFEFWSAVNPGVRFFGNIRAPGELLVGLPVAGGQLVDLLFRLP